MTTKGQCLLRTGATDYTETVQQWRLAKARSRRRLQAGFCEVQYSVDSDSRRITATRKLPQHPVRAQTSLYPHAASYLVCGEARKSPSADLATKCSGFARYGKRCAPPATIRCFRA